MGQVSRELRLRGFFCQPQKITYCMISFIEHPPNDSDGEQIKDGMGWRREGGQCN